MCVWVGVCCLRCRVRVCVSVCVFACDRTTTLDPLAKLTTHQNKRQHIITYYYDTQGWEWEGPWEVETGGSVDAEGWAYAFDIAQLRYPPAPGAGAQHESFTSFMDGQPHNQSMTDAQPHPQQPSFQAPAQPAPRLDEHRSALLRELGL